MYIPNEEDIRLRELVATRRRELRVIRDLINNDYLSANGAQAHRVASASREAREALTTVVQLLQLLITNYGVLDFVDRSQLDMARWLERNATHRSSMLWRRGVP